MNIYSVNYNNSNYKQNNIHRIKQNVSFSGVKPAIKNQQAKECAKGLAEILLLPLLVPLALFSGLFNRKNDSIDSSMKMIEGEYMNHLGRIEFFQTEVERINRILDKHSVNDEYSQFAKDALAFLQARFEAFNDSDERLEPFEDENMEIKRNWFIFIDAINESAKAAISKNYKDIDKLNKNIQLAREMMQK